MKVLGRFLIVIISLSASISYTFAAEKEVTLSIPGMVWSHCQTSVEKSLQAVKGVKRADVDLEKKEAIVTYDDQQADVAALINATARAGFKSAVKK